MYARLFCHLYTLVTLVITQSLIFGLPKQAMPSSSVVCVKVCRSLGPIAAASGDDVEPELQQREQVALCTQLGALIREKNICQALLQSRLNLTNQSTSKSTQLHRLILWKRVSLFVLSPAGFPFFTDHGDRRDFLSHHPIHF